MIIIGLIRSFLARYKFLYDMKFTAKTLLEKPSEILVIVEFPLGRRLCALATIKYKTIAIIYLVILSVF